MRIAYLAALSSFLFAAGHASAAVNLVQNGGFETGSLSSWTVSGNQFDIGVCGSPCPEGGVNPHSGNYSAYLGAVGSLGFLNQTLATSAGTSYNLTFFLESDGDVPNEIDVEWNGHTVYDATNVGAFGYTQYTFNNLVATGSSTVLSFSERDDPGYFHLDDVSVMAASATPEPTSIVLLGSAALLAGVLARRRKSRLIL